MTDARQIAVIRSGQGYNAFDLFLQTFFKRRVELGISGETLDDITGLTTRYSQKILEGKKLFGRQSFGEMLGGLGIQITISEDREALEKIQKRLERSPLDESQIRVHANARMCVPRWLFNPRKASKAAKKRWAKVPKKKRARAARKAARIRWSRPRVVDITQTAIGQKLVKGMATYRAPSGDHQEAPIPSAQLATHPQKKPKRRR
jgi:hypothetical protein